MAALSGATLRDTISATGPRFTPMGENAVGHFNQLVTLGTAAVGNAGSLVVGYLPKGALVTDAKLSITDVDTGAAFVCSLGDAGDLSRFINGGTIGQSAGTLRSGNDATSSAKMAALTPYTADTAVIFNTITAAATAAAGTAMIDIDFIVP